GARRRSPPRGRRRGARPPPSLETRPQRPPRMRAGGRRRGRRGAWRASGDLRRACYDAPLTCKTGAAAMNSASLASASLPCVAAGTAGAQQAQPAPQPAAGPSPAASVGLVAYPAKGQTAEQQSADENACYDWSKSQTGYDPKNPPKVEVAAAEPASKGP